jgi:hypothetical protein
MALLVAIAIPAGVWLVNGYLPMPALVLGATLGCAVWMKPPRFFP